ncbi:FMN-dependent dehydrogenase [Phaeosphaeriaceae sp. PMI808]|nr:FMN-dependent dehydrogenase [Phaeosphaeriaceae sp. PMI808]
MHAPNPTLSWDRGIPWLKAQCHPEMQVWVKSIATSEDTLLACHHGGRQLNGALATIDTLSGVVDALRSHRLKIPVHADGGIRHGADTFKELTLGADFVWGLAYNGRGGVELCLGLSGDEFRLCMGLTGVTKVEDIGKEYLARVDRSGFVSQL